MGLGTDFVDSVEVFKEGLKRRLMAETAGESILLGAFETDAHGLASGFRISAE